MNMTSKNRWLLTCLVGALALSTSTGCGKLAEIVAEKAAQEAGEATPGAATQAAVVAANAPAAVPAVAKTELNYFVDASTVKSAFKEKVGGPVRLFEAVVYPPMGEYVGTRFMAEVQNPIKKLEADKYTLQNGEWKDTQPIRWTGSMPTEKDLEVQSFDLESIDLGIVPVIIKDAPAQLGYDNPKVSHAILKRELPFSKEIRWRVFVNSERRSGSVTYDVNGKLVKKYE